MSRVVFGVDLTSAHVSIARVADDGSMPKTKRIDVHNAGACSTATMVQRIESAATKTVDALTKNGHPDLVVMAKFWTTSGMDREPAQARRAWLWYSIVSKLTALNIPVAELPMLTVMSWAGTMVDLRKGAIDLLAQDVRTKYSGITEPENYRLTTVAFACIGAMSIGIETEYAVTTDRLKKLNGNTRNAVQCGTVTPPADCI